MVRTFQARLLWLIVAVLALLEAGTLISVHLAGQRTLQRSVRDQLHVGVRVLNQQLDDRAQQLSYRLGILAADFAFREAIATGDVPTITSALENAGGRAKTDAVVLLDLDGNIITDTLGGRLGR